MFKIFAIFIVVIMPATAYSASCIQYRDSIDGLRPITLTAGGGSSDGDAFSSIGISGNQNCGSYSTTYYTDNNGNYYTGYSCNTCNSGYNKSYEYSTQCTNIGMYICEQETCTESIGCSTTWYAASVTGYIYRTCTKEDCSTYREYDCAEGYSQDGSGVSCVRSLPTLVWECNGCEANTPSCNEGEYLLGNSCATCTAGYRCPGDNNRYKCTPGTYSDAGQASCASCPPDYKNSEAGATSSDSCYTNIKRGCTQNEDSTPSGCASVTAWDECSCTEDTYIKYANGTTSGDTSNETCTKEPKTVTASANHYVSGKTCPACSSYSSEYPSSDGGNITYNKCYGEFSKSGIQEECSPTSDNVESYACASSCTPGSCTYTRYANGDIREDTCVPTNCTKDLVSVTCKSGYYPQDNDKKCILCTVGHYCNGSIQEQCPEIESRPGERGTSKEGSKTKGDCYVPKSPNPLTATDDTGTYVCLYDAYYQTGTH